MTFKRAAYQTLNRGPGRHLVGLAASAFAIARGDRAWITYDPPTTGWVTRTRAGATLNSVPTGMSAAKCEALTRNDFLYDYSIRPGDVVLDIGAGTGTETLPFSTMVGDSGKVVAAEAHPATFAMLERMCELNRLRNVELVQAAVMDSDQPVKISDLPADLSYENRIGAEGIQVPAVTITDLVSKLTLDRIDFLKMNIEGAEVAALRGARDVLPIVRHAAIGCHDFLADETGDESYRTMETVRALLVAAGFTVITREGDPRPWAADYLFASR